MPVTDCGAVGTAPGVAVTDDEALDPDELIDVARATYAVPLVSDPNVQAVGPEVHVHVAPPGVRVISYPVIGESPTSVEATHEISRPPDEADAWRLAGGSGTPCE